MRAFALFLAAITALTPALTLPASAQDTAPAAAAILPAITVSAIEARPMRDRVIASGLVGPQQQVLITPMVQGQQVAELLADVGDKVVAGQVLARLSSSALSLQQSQLAAALASAKAAGDAAATATLQANLDKVTADLARIASILKRTEIEAPVAGEIVARNAILGEMAGATGQPMFTIIRDSILELQADVSEADLLRLQAGQRVEMRLVNADQPVTGFVRLIEPTLNATTRLGRVRIAFDDSTQVRSGMFVEAAIMISERDALAVPVTALSRYEGQPVVMAVVDGVAQRRNVTLGIREGGWLEITGGVAAGDIIVTKAGSFVRDGDKINPVPEATQTN